MWLASEAKVKDLGGSYGDWPRNTNKRSTILQKRGTEKKPPWLKVDEA